MYGFVNKTDTPVLVMKQSKVHSTINEWSKYASVAFYIQPEGMPQICIAFNPQGGSRNYC